MDLPALPTPPGDGGVDALRAAPSRMPVSGDSLVPWLVGGLSGGAVIVVGVLSGRRWTSIELTVLALALLGWMAATIGVALRSRAATAAADRDERTRPALDEILAGAALVRSSGVEVHPGSPPYLVGMARWTAAFVELLDHATESAREAGRSVAVEELAAAREDTAALRDLLEVSRGAAVGMNETASLHTICTLWEANQSRYEALSAEVDGRWYRRWRAHTVVERRLRHGAAHAETLVLPYSA
jgi:hypothetical protein